MSVIERVEYRSSGANTTVAKRSAWIDSQVFGFSRAIRAFGVERFRKNCTQMYNGFNGVLLSLFPKPMTPQHMTPMTHTLKEMRDAAAAATDRAKANVLSSVNRT
ncbi:protein preli-like [Choristoneura fumiferana]